MSPAKGLGEIGVGSRETDSGVEAERRGRQAAIHTRLGVSAMPPCRRPRRRAGFRWVGAALVVALVAAGCSKSSVSGTGHAISGGTATFAEGPGAAPNYIFPLYSAEYWSPANTAQLQQLLYPPLYWYGEGTTTNLNPQLSLADAPVYSDGDRTVTITLKSGYSWSDGQPVTSRDVEFWINLLRANKVDYGPYAPGSWPDNLTSASYPNAKTVVLHLNHGYSPAWFTNMELPEITPMPQQAWDRTSANGPVGNYDLTTSGAKKVYAFLNTQSEDTSTYASNPLWKVVDGPWTLQQYTTDGGLTFVRNAKYSGADKPRLSKLVELPYTSEPAENDELLTGALDYGYISASDFAEVPRLKRLGYEVTPWPLWETGFLNMNWSNPTTGPLIEPQYMRIAMQELIDQPLLIKTIFHGYATPAYGGVPTEPRTSFADAAQYDNPYPYDPAKAIASLTSHGWKVVPNGVSTCVDPSKCGPGIKMGAGLTFPTIYPAGVPTDLNEMSAIQSSMSAAGIRLKLTALSTTEVGESLAECKPNASCNWSMILYQTGGYYFDPGPYPDGSEPFGLGIVSFEGKADYLPALDPMIEAARTASPATQLQALYRYEDYVRTLDPDLWIPATDFQISVIKNTLHGTLPQDSLAGNMTPQLWYLTSG